MPDPEFDLLGTEYVLYKPDYYPIKTYKDYEKPDSGEHLDPLRHVWEVMSHLKEGEYIIQRKNPQSGKLLELGMIHNWDRKRSALYLVWEVFKNIICADLQRKE